MNKKNPAGLKGISFIEYSSAQPEQLAKLWKSMGFSQKGTHKKKPVDLFSQGYTHFVLNRKKQSFADQFSSLHGPSVCALAFRVHSAQKAFDWALSRGAEPVSADTQSHSFPAIYGVGGSVIYFVEDDQHFEKEFNILSSFKAESEEVGLLSVDHLTHNVPLGDMQKWCDFYQQVFNFQETRYFDIQGKKTALRSKVMRSPCRSITIPINEPVEGERGRQSQIQEFLEEYHGAGVQHIALSSKNIVNSVKKLKSRGLEFLNVPDTYYEDLCERALPVQESLADLKENHILADGDKKGYLLQIFTKNVIGPVFYEIITRRGCDGFGEGNFQALFNAIERDQIQRGALN